jgi:hypothetical protein
MSEKNSATFKQDQNIKLVLEADGGKSELLAGNIEGVFLDLHSYGFTGSVRFSGSNNTDLNTLFHSKKPIKVTLTFFPTDPKKIATPLLELKGIVTERRWKRVDVANDTKKIPEYRYQINFSDNAKVTWEEHFPLSIYVNKSMKEIFEEHKNPEITLKYDFPPLENKHPVTAFSLRHNDSLPPSKQSSFYPFLAWYLHHEGGIFSYDYKDHTYTILAKKKPAEGEPFKIREAYVLPLSGLVAYEPRYNEKIIKHNPDSMDPEDKENENSFKSVRRDSIHPEKYRIHPEHSYAAAKSSFEFSLPEMEFYPLTFKDDFSISKLVPGSYITFFSDKSSWTSDPLIKDKVFRTRVLIFTAIRTTNSGTHKTVQPYQITLRCIVEPKDETYIERPPFSPPIFPFEIEGQVFSDVAPKEQTTFKISEEVPKGQYLVKVPLAGKDLKVVVPFTPNMTSGQHYFPYYKDEKVLLDLYFHTAQIKKVVDWNKLVQLPSTVQGVQTVYGSHGKDKYALLKHEYEGGENSVLTIKQSTSAPQVQIITLKDKELIIKVEEKDKKTVLMRYHCDEGVTISYANEESKDSQEIKMDGKQITQTCKDSSDTSTIVQTPTSCTFTCKDFNIKSDNIKTDIKDAVNHKVGSKFNIEAPVINAKGDMKVGG